MMNEDPGAAPTIAALLPLKVTGRHYAENLSRLDVLLSSLLHFGARDVLDEIVIVTPTDEVALAQGYAANWPEIPIRVVGEAGHFAVFGKYAMPWQVRPWQRQQIIKLNAPALTDADFILTLDPDVVARAPLSRATLLPGGRALLQTESRSVHRRWWIDSSRVLRVHADLDRPGMGVTPAVLSRDILLQMQARIEKCNGRPWMNVLLTSYSEWTEYTLYLLAAEHHAMVDQFHHRCGDATSGAVSPLLISESSIWSPVAHGDDEQRLRDLVSATIAGSDSSLFSVVASNTGTSANVVAEAASAVFPVRLTPVGEPPEGRRLAKIRERAVTASRLAASAIYRARSAGRRPMLDAD